eukprot:1495063-Pleurochrysis_carterae.AAC.6
MSFRSLRVSLVPDAAAEAEDEGQPKDLPFRPNGDPVKIDTPWFEGHALILIRPQTRSSCERLRCFLAPCRRAFDAQRVCACAGKVGMLQGLVLRAHQQSPLPEHPSQPLHAAYLLTDDLVRSGSSSRPQSALKPKVVCSLAVAGSSSLHASRAQEPRAYAEFDVRAVCACRCKCKAGSSRLPLAASSSAVR